VVKTVPFDISASFIIGMLVPLAGAGGLRSADSVLANRFFLAVVLFEVLFFIPLGTYLYFFYPGWSLMYFINPEALAPDTLRALGIMALASYMMSAIAGYLLSAVLIRRGKENAASLILAAAALLLGVFSALTLARLFQVGTYAQWTAAPAAAKNLMTHRIGYVIGIDGLAATAALFMLIRELRKTDSPLRPA